MSGTGVKRRRVRFPLGISADSRNPMSLFRLRALGWVSDGRTAVLAFEGAIVCQAWTREIFGGVFRQNNKKGNTENDTHLAYRYVAAVARWRRLNQEKLPICGHLQYTTQTRTNLDQHPLSSPADQPSGRRFTSIPSLNWPGMVLSPEPGVGEA